jgi:hypothetical protein
MAFGTNISYFGFRCSWGECSLALLTKQEECFSCKDIDRCTEKLEECEDDLDCICDHPGFRYVCLDKWVIVASATELKTRQGRKYTVMKSKGLASQSQ